MVELGLDLDWDEIELSELSIKEQRHELYFCIKDFLFIGDDHTPILKYKIRIGVSIVSLPDDKWPGLSLRPGAPHGSWTSDNPAAPSLSPCLHVCTCPNDTSPILCHVLRCSPGSKYGYVCYVKAQICHIIYCQSKNSGICLQHTYQILNLSNWIVNCIAVYVQTFKPLTKYLYRPNYQSPLSDAPCNLIH